MIINPDEIEKKSFEIISKELGHMNICKEYDSIVKRVIHATADFEYARILQFHPEAIDSALKSIKQGVRIYTDTRMIEAGVNKKKLGQSGSMIFTYIDNEDIGIEAKKKGTTRSIAAINKVFYEENVKIFVIGNAPTALFRLRELIDEIGKKPDLIIGVPVGFVGAAESKEEIKKCGAPFIVANGRKGGSTVAVAILNALIYKIIK
jgi:precorrin-8X/cobalt-precorrin-8 methylmutase